MMTVLIVDDELDLARSVQFAIEQAGWRAVIAETGHRGLELARQVPPPSLILLDVMLPDISGMDVCRRLRAGAETRDIPIIMVTARDDEVDRVVGFELGVDDYVVKPFAVRELLLRARALLRRIHQTSHSAPLSFGRLKIDIAGFRAHVDDEEIPLTALEFRLLQTLIDRRGRAQSRAMLLHDVWGHAPSIPTRTVDTHIQRLRKKLGAAGDYIETVRGVGYRFAIVPDKG
jgi:two-component system phosphate regulon response regulator PhoB